MTTMKSWLSLCLFAITTSVQAAVVVEFAESSRYSVWLASKDGTVIAGPDAVTGAKGVIETGEEASTGGWTLFVTNADGNAASVEVPAGDKPRIALSADDFTRIAAVALKVTNVTGAVPESAAVTLKDGKGKATTKVLTAADKGVASFDMVSGGDGSVRVQQGSARNAQTVTVRLPLERKTPLLEVPIAVSLPDGMKVLPVGSEGTVPKSKEAGKDAEASASSDAEKDSGAADADKRDAGRTVGAIIGLFLLAGVGWLGYSYLRGKGITAEDALARAGIHVEPDGNEVQTVLEAVAPAIDPAVCRFCGQTKDPATGSCACTLSAAGAPAVPQASVAPPQGGRLVALSGPRAGSTWALAGTVTIGRDPVQDVAITEDSALSRRHASVQTENGSLTLVDQGSSNGTFVNGQRVMRHELRQGDEIVMGGTRFRFEAS